jgi:hypothetical protein
LDSSVCVGDDPDVASEVVVPIRVRPSVVRPRNQKQSFSLLDAMIALITLVIGVVVIVVAVDPDQRRVDPPSPEPVQRRNVPRPDWVWNLASSYRRMQHDYVFVVAVATLGVGAILATDKSTWTRRGISRPGTLAVVLALLVGTFQIVTLIVNRWPSFSAAASFGYDIRNQLEHYITGAILGAWVALACCGLWRASDNWKETAARMVGWGWLGTFGFLIGYGLLFG